MAKTIVGVDMALVNLKGGGTTLVSRGSDLPADAADGEVKRLTDLGAFTEPKAASTAAPTAAAAAARIAQLESQLATEAAARQAAETALGTSGGTPPVTAKKAMSAGDDPGEYKVEEVQAYLASADDQERDRVLAAERDGKGRSGLVGS